MELTSLLTLNRMFQQRIRASKIIIAIAQAAKARNLLEINLNPYFYKNFNLLNNFVNAKKSLLKNN